MGVEGMQHLFTPGGEPVLRRLDALQQLQQLVLLIRTLLPTAQHILLTTEREERDTRHRKGRGLTFKYTDTFTDTWTHTQHVLLTAVRGKEVQVKLTLYTIRAGTPWTKKHFQ